MQNQSNHGDTVPFNVSLTVIFVLGVKRAVVANPRRDTCSREFFRHEVGSVLII